MADYARTELTFRYSENSDYSDPEIALGHTKTYTSPTEVQRWLVSVATGADTTVYTSNFTTVQGVIIRNRDDSKYVKATYQSADTASQTCRVLAGDSAKIPDISTSSNILLRADASDSDTVLTEVIIWGT